MNTLPQSCWDKFVTHGLPALTAFAVVGTAIGGIIKYYKSKNKETYEKILKEVYSPLYQYFVKQELFAKIHMPDRDYKEYPILDITNTKITIKSDDENANKGAIVLELCFENQELFVNIHIPDIDYKESLVLDTTNTKTTTKSDGRITNKEIEETVVLNLTRYEFIKVKDNINIGLATQELLTLLNMYEVCIFMEEKYSESDEEYWEATNLKVDVENAIRHEVFTGYKKYYKKLGLDKIKEVDLWELTDNQIVFKYEAERQKRK